MCKEVKALHSNQRHYFYLTVYFCLIWFPASANQNISEVKDRPLQVIERPLPQYPTLALMKGVEGWVKVIFTVSKTGEILNPTVLEANPPNVFEYSAIQATKNFKINPATKNGEVIAQKATQTIEYNLPRTSIVETYKKINSAIQIEMPNLLNDSSLGLKSDLPDDVVIIFKSIKTKSKIKTHKKSLKKIVVKLLPDKNGRPFKGQIVENSYGKSIDQIKLNKLIDGVVLRAQFTYDRFYGYYNPTFTMTSAKNQPARVIPTFMARSKSIPDLSIDFVLTANIIVNQNGKIIEINNSNIDGHEINPEITMKMLDGIHFFEANKRYKSISDELELKIIYSLIQKPVF